MEAFSQEKNYRIQRITTEIQKTHPGISQNTIRCIFQDHKGFLWFGTWDGLNKYDGIRFLIIRDEMGNESGTLNNSTINDIDQDKQNNMWIATDGGINCFTYAEMYKKELDYLNNPDFLYDTIHSVHVDYKNQVWIGAHNGLGMITNGRDSLLMISDIIESDSLLSQTEVRQIHQIKRDELWLGTSNGVFRINLISKEVIHLDSIALTNQFITSILSVGDSLLFIGTENGFNKIDLSTLEVTKLYLNYAYKDDMGSNVVLSTLQNTDTTLFVGFANNGLYEFNINQQKFNNLKLSNTGTEDVGFFEPSTEEISSMFKDYYENIWLGTSFDGVVALSPEPLLFKTFRKSSKKYKGLNNNHIWCFLKETNKLWVGTENGINIYDFDTHKVIYKDISNGLSSNKIRCLYKDSKDDIWIGTADKGINIITKEGKINRYSANDKEPIIGHNTVWDFTETSDGKMWVSTHNGLSCVDMDSFNAEIYRNDNEDSTSLSSNTIYDTYFDTRGVMWVSTYRGLNRLLSEKEGFKRYFHIKKDSNSLSTNKIFKVYDDGEGYLWIATIGGGLNKMNLETEDIEWFTTNDGLSNNVIYSLIDDGMGYLWLSNNNGISRFHKETYSVNSYSVKDGLQSNEFNFGADYIDSSFNIYMGGMKGFNVFSPGDINNSIKKAPVEISEFKTIKEGSSYNIEFGDTIILEHNNNFFDISFTSLNLKKAGEHLFRYRLYNYDHEWKVDRLGTAGINYSNVEPGIYKFFVQSAGSEGIWDANNDCLTIIVKQIWYKSWWFRLSLILIVIALGYALVLIRIKRIRFMGEVERKILHLEKQALRLQMNPHFIFNTLNSIQSYILNNKTQESISYLSKFSKLMRSILNNSTDSIISMKSEIEMLRHYLILERLRFDQCFDFEFYYEKNLDLDFIGIPGMILQPYVENAIIHGVAPLKNRKGKINIYFKLIDGRLHCKIEDNGVGRGFYKERSPHLHKPKGMHISLERLQILNKTEDDNMPISIEDLKDEKGKPCGTVVNLLIDTENLND